METPPLINPESIQEARTVFNETAKLNAALQDQNGRYEIVSRYAEAEMVESAVETETDPQVMQGLQRKRQALEQKIEESEAAYPQLLVLKSLSREDRSSIVANMITGIAKEQQQTFTDLAYYGIAYGEEVYGEVGLTYLLTDKAQDDIRASIDAHDAKMQTKQDRLDVEIDAARSAKAAQDSDVLNVVNMFAPLAQDPVKAHLDKQPDNVTSGRIKELENEMYELMRAQENLRVDARHIGEQSKSIEALYAEGGSAWTIPRVILNELGSEAIALAYLDELPVDPDFREQNAEKFDSIRRRCIDAPEASINTALYFELHAGEVVTVDNLIETLYPNRPLPYHLYRTRVTSFLGPKRGQVPPILRDGGYTLQYGWRRYLERANGRITAKTSHRIYRVIPTDKLADYAEGSTYEAEDGFTDTFPSINSEQGQEPAQEDTSTNINVGNPTRPEQSSSPKASSSSRETRKDKANQDKAQRVETWKKTYLTKIGKVINELEEMRLLSQQPEPVSVKIARLQHRSAIFATDEMIRRLIEASWLPSFTTANADNWPEQLLKPEDLVLMTLFKPDSKNPLSKGSGWRDIAFETIEEALEAFFHNKNKEKQEGKKT